MGRFVCIHGHFYQPPRENPWLDEVELQDSANPYHDWNERITAESYAPNAFFVESSELPAGFVERWTNTLLAEDAECGECPFFTPCRGYFQWPGRDYDCAGVKTLFHTLQQAADELRRDLAAVAPVRGDNSP